MHVVALGRPETSGFVGVRLFSPKSLPAALYAHSSLVGAGDKSVMPRTLLLECRQVRLLGLIGLGTGREAGEHRTKGVEHTHTW